MCKISVEHFSRVHPKLKDGTQIYMSLYAFVGRVPVGTVAHAEAFAWFFRLSILQEVYLWAYDELC